jgi:threonine dehydrogenase-like Zn-dependent dehydrogenase
MRMDMQMNALQVVLPRSFVRVMVPMPHLDTQIPDRILVRTRWVSMCGSDIPFFTGSKRLKPYPLPPGAPMHECAGEIVESTSGYLPPGAHVVAIPEGNLGLAEYFVADTARAVRLPIELVDCDMSCLIQPLSTVMNAVDRLGRIQGQSITVVGLGSIGQFFCWLLRREGAGQIVGIDPCAHRCQVAEQFGATRTICARSIEVVHRARQRPDFWTPADICIEAVGHQMETLNDCLELVRRLGTVLAFGVPDHPVYAIEFETFFRKNANLLAAVTPVWSEYLTKARDLFVACRNELAPLVTHRLSIQDAGEAFTLYERHDGGILKALLDTNGWGRNSD